MRAPGSLPVYAVLESGARRVRVRPGTRDVHEALAGAGVAVYTAMACVGPAGVVSLSAHLARLADSCRRAGLSVPDPVHLRRALADVVATVGPDGCMLRLEVRAVPAPRVESDATILLASWPARTRDARDGVAVVTSPGARRIRPRVKSSAWITERGQWLDTTPADEHVLVDAQGEMLEGFTSNLLGVVGEEIWSPEAGVLPGVTLGRVLELCEDLGLKVRRRPIPRDRRLSELALTSAGRGIWPVVSVDAQPVGTGRPGPVVQQLLRAWERALPGWVEPP